MNKDKYCEKCNHTGSIVWIEDGYAYAKPCECQIKLDFERRIKRSGLANLFEEYTFDKFTVKASWQKVIKDKALSFIENPFGHWFYIGGNSGSGKTMICTAMVSKLVEQGHDAYYFQWREDSVKLKMNINDFEYYNNLLNKYKNVKVLYIDDLFKGNLSPSEADLRLLFDLINYRYNNKELITIISSEKLIDDIIEIDQAIGSRIYQRSKEYNIKLAENKALNQRMI